MRWNTSAGTWCGVWLRFPYSQCALARSEWLTKKVIFGQGEGLTLCHDSTSHFLYGGVNLGIKEVIVKR